MKTTLQEFDEVIGICRELFVKKCTTIVRHGVYYALLP